MILWSLLALIACISAQSFECEGFVKSPVDIDYSKISIQLLTQENFVKSTIEVDPKSGYYIIPFEGKDKYNLKVQAPKGWSFDPVQVMVNGKDEKNPCVSGDVDFIFNGFSVMGKISESDGSSGPSDYTVTLQNGKTMSVVKTEKFGSFVFEKVFPGEYVLSVAHPNTSFKKSEMKVEVTNDNLEVPNELIITGYTVKGKVENDGEGVPGVNFLLVSKSTVLNCSPEIEGKINEKIEGVACIAQSNGKGEFLFKNVPSGEYTIVPKFVSGSAEFAVLPSSSPFSINSGGYEFKQPFLVSGFGITGKVLHQQTKKGVSSADVYIDGVKKTTTDSHGFYRMDHITSGDKKITAVKDGIKFLEQVVKVSPSQTTMPDIVTSSYSVCGKISSEQQSKNRAVVATNKISKSTFKSVTNSQSQFCFDLPPGNYEISPVISQQESESGFILSPPSLTISVEDDLINDLFFGQSKSKIFGEISFPSGKCEDLEVVLSNKSRGFNKVTKPVVSNNLCTYSFSDVLPGSYNVAVKDGNKYCWEKLEIEALVQSEDFKVEQIKQIGHKIKITSEQDLVIKVKNSKKQETFQKGENFLCVSSLDSLEIENHECFQFVSTSFDLKSSNSVHLKIAKFKVQGSVEVSQGHASEIEVLEEGKLISVEMSKSNEYGFWAQKSLKYLIKPKDLKDVLYFPATREFSVEAPQCNLKVEPFIAKIGEYIEGQITPSIGDAIVTAIHSQSGHQTKATSSKDGKFKLGPLYDPSYEITIEKEGYSFSKHPSLKHHFEAKKLSQLIIEIKDQNNKPIQGVLVAANGEKNREKGSTKENGRVVFSGVPIGSYYVKPVLKEYSFEPASSSATVEEGATIVKFVATRVAFSCLGKVVSLNGHPEVGLTIEAIGNGQVEEVQTNENGLYHLKGLQPGIKYNVRVKKGESNPSVWKAIPSSGIDFEMKNEDLENVDFLVISKQNSFEISGVVDVPLEFLSNLRVELISDSSRSAIKTLQAGPTQYFEFSNLPKDTGYSVNVKLDSHKHSYECTSAKVDSSSVEEKLSAFVSISCKITEKATESHVQESSIFSLLLVILVAAAAINKDRIMEYYRRNFQETSIPDAPERATFNFQPKKKN